MKFSILISAITVLPAATYAKVYQGTKCTKADVYKFTHLGYQADGCVSVQKTQWSVRKTVEGDWICGRECLATFPNIPADKLKTYRTYHPGPGWPSQCLCCDFDAMEGI
ncbi:hypothetical protein FKW77_000324 [Venturia effusa]|uniref:Uncharacterized protein n=1 Tax=Venturia effusa TaxID=50376 RepID=A0A517LA85_9PEZI|nr:hypothetical protein FKW77_000324 [Venturia effusa]